eukprot:10847097-Alexandrium_andersonii.AAC.1
MSASLVGSEMCIRDSPYPSARKRAGRPRGSRRVWRTKRPPAARNAAVSYTHLTLPTICSV